MGRGFVERATCGLYEHFSRPLLPFVGGSFLKNIFGLMSSTTVGIAVLVIVSSVCLGRGLKDFNVGTKGEVFY